MRITQRAAFRKSFSLSTNHSPLKPGKILLRLWNKGFHMEIYRNLQTFSKYFKDLVLGRQEILLCKFFFFFLTPNRKICKWERFFAVLREHIIFDTKLVEVHKMSEAFWAKLYCKMSKLFRKFLLSLRLSAIDN